MATIGSLVVSVQGDASGFGKALKESKKELSSYGQTIASMAKVDFWMKTASQAFKAADAFKKAEFNAQGIATVANQFTGSQFFDGANLQMGAVRLLEGAEGARKLFEQRQKQLEVERQLSVILKDNQKWEAGIAAGQAMLDALSKEIEQWDMGPIEKTIDDLKKLRADKEHVVEIENLLRIKEGLEAERDIKRQVEEVNAQLIEQEREMEKAKAAEAAAAAQAKLNAEFADTERLLEALKTPADKFAEEVARINELFEAGNFDQATFEALIGKAGEGLGDKSKQDAVRGSAALARGGAGAVSAINAFRDQGRLVKPDDPQKKLVAEAIAQRKALDKANQELNDIAGILREKREMFDDLGVVEF